MAHAMKTAVRNIVILFIGAVIFAMVFARSEWARSLLSPPGLQLPPGLESPRVDSTSGGPSNESNQESQTTQEQ